MSNKKRQSRAALEYGCELYEEGNLQEAFKVFLRASRLGNPQAQVNLANMYDSGDGVEQDREVAAHWYKLAIRKKVPEAAYNLAVSYQQQGKTKWSKYWFSRAAEMGDEDAMAELAKGRLADSH